MANSKLTIKTIDFCYEFSQLMSAVRLLRLWIYFINLTEILVVSLKNIIANLVTNFKLTTACYLQATERILLMLFQIRKDWNCFYFSNQPHCYMKMIILWNCKCLFHKICKNYPANKLNKTSSRGRSQISWMGQ